MKNEENKMWNDFCSSLLGHMNLNPHFYLRTLSNKKMIRTKSLINGKLISATKGECGIKICLHNLDFSINCKEYINGQEAAFIFYSTLNSKTN